MKEETKNKLKKFGKLALGAALLGGAAYAGKKAWDNKQELMNKANEAKDTITSEINNKVNGDTTNNKAIIGGTTGATVGGVIGNKLSKISNAKIDKLRDQALKNEDARFKDEQNRTHMFKTTEDVQKREDLIKSKLKNVRDEVGKYTRDRANGVTVNSAWIHADERKKAFDDKIASHGSYSQRRNARIDKAYKNHSDIIQSIKNKYLNHGNKLATIIGAGAGALGGVLGAEQL